ncbi:AMP-binding protein [Bradyrhizobium arachidis]|uniref:AMP-binding protein n=1 Tax=Bradyrhizobium arachidis TaxID=858423 RepID=UPI0021FBB72A|nr:AMP-binding protein [Bradyrhizobium arachidis]
MVGYCGGRDLDWATAVIAIWKAGSTDLPLDPSLPASRTSFMIEQSRCALLMGRDRPDSLSLFQKSSKAAPQFRSYRGDTAPGADLVRCAIPECGWTCLYSV